jgi:hypothetical protein
LHLAQIQREGCRDEGGVETEGERDEEMKREGWRQRERGMER